ncbi:hypothetical protein F2Q69_00025222 [Brassica cretica]|uniref:NYN domain-containing protein n=1 Tax=Brassica cretica TaxID=69181 RepID=A0A8S9Q9J7_BRACR|nr:hypothetical protein F2Q69_00025222 [Brassica cretica]
MVRFTDKQIARFRTAEVVVCWDMVGCPIPSGMNVVTVSNNIRGSVKKVGYQGHIEINAFGYSLPSVGDLLDAKVTMKVLTEGDVEERLQMILSHFLCRAVEYRKRVNLMLIIGDISRHSQFNFECAFNLLEMKRYNCILAQPKYLPILEEDTITTTWLWDTLSTGGQALRRRLKFADDDDHTSLDVVDYTSTGMPRSMSYEFSACYFDQCPLTEEDIEGKGEGHIKGEGRRRRRRRQRQRQRRRISSAPRSLSIHLLTLSMSICNKKEN